MSANVNGNSNISNHDSPQAHNSGPSLGDIKNMPRTPFLIGVAGGTASGKSTVCGKIMEKLGQDTIDRSHQRVVCISQDSFYRELDADERDEAFKGNYNFDHPDALDHDLIKSILMDVLNEKQVQLPIYDFTNMRKTDEYKVVYPADVVLRDVQERGRDLEFVLGQYTNFVKPAFEDFCLPTKKYADVIIPRGADNEVAIDLIVQMINDYLTTKQDIRRLINRPTSPPSPGGRSRFATGSGCFGTSPPINRPH